MLDAILKVKDETDGSIGIRCSCQQAICGSCGVRMNGKPGLACNTHLDEAAERGHGTGWNPPDEGQDGRRVITVEPMGNMPVIRDLIVDMDAVHWKKIQRVTPWLINKEPVPEREYIVPHENMVDVTQTMACIQCGACVSDCLSMEVDPLFVGPAALAKAYRFVGDPRDAEHARAPEGPRRGPARDLRLHPLLQLHRRLPQGRRPDEPDHAPAPRSPAPTTRSTTATTATATSTRSSSNIRDNGLLHEADLLPDSYGGEVQSPRAVPELVSSLPTIVTAAGAGQDDARSRRCCTSTRRPRTVKRIFDEVEGREERVELNLYVTGYEDEPEDGAASGDAERRPGSRGHGREAARSRARRRASPTPSRAARTHEGRLLARLREPRLHPRAARLDGQGRAAARHRADRARPGRAAAAPA